MQLGIYLNAQHPEGEDPGRRFSETLEQVQLIRQLGFDSIWGGEHHITDGFHYFPLLPMLQRVAHAAEGLHIGTNIVLLPLHNPIELAEIGAFMDMTTEGKFLLGVGLGYRPEEFAMYRVPMSERVSRLSEGVEIIRRLWTEDRVTFKGRHWQLENCTIRPRPIRRPHPPILVASQVDAGIKRAARIADGWCMVPTPATNEVTRQVAVFHAERATAGLDPSEHICRIYEVVCAPDEEQALRRAAPHLLTKYAAYMSWGLPGITLEPDAAPEEQLRLLAANRFAVGSPEQVIEAICKQYKAGLTHLAMRVSWPGMRQEDILASIDLLGRHVLPEVRRRTSTS